TESDVTLAEASGTAVIGFNVRAHKEAREAAEHAGIEIRYYNIIYDLVDDVKKAMSGLLAPTLRETLLGNATILEIFKVSKVGNGAACRASAGRRRGRFAWHRRRGRARRQRAAYSRQCRRPSRQALAAQALQG